MEHKGEIESELAARIGNRLFGCDECVMACPHHTAAPSRTNAGLRFYPERQYLDLRHILEMPPEQFDSDYAHSPIHRRRLDGLKQNARICIENLKSK
jgi:epoxyqueuosine reductase